MSHRRNFLAAIAFTLLAINCNLSHAIDLNGPWYTGGLDGTPAISNPNSNSFEWGDAAGGSTTATRSGLWTYFADQAISNDGDFVEVSFGVNFGDDVNILNGFRFGLYDNNGSTETMNISGAIFSTQFAASRGYYTITTTNDNTNARLLVFDGTAASTPDGNVLTSVTDTGFANEPVNTQSSIMTDTEIPVSLRILRQDSLSYLVTHTINGESVSATTTNIAADNFNAFHLQGTNQIGSLLTFSDFTVTSGAIVEGDTNGDGIVDIETDFEAIRTNFLLDGASLAQGDVDANGIVNFADFRIWKTQFETLNGFAPSVSFAVVPEPSALVLVGLLGSGALAIRRTRRLS